MSYSLAANFDTPHFARATCRVATRMDGCWFHSRQKECGHPRKKTVGLADVRLLRYKPRKSVTISGRPVAHTNFSPLFSTRQAGAPAPTRNQDVNLPLSRLFSCRISALKANDCIFAPETTLQLNLNPSNRIFLQEVSRFSFDFYCLMW